MAFQLNQVVPWGRSLEEYRAMFLLSDKDMSKQIASFGDGPASFNCEATLLGYSIKSFDPIYQFTKAQIQQRIEEVRKTVMEQMAANQENYTWTKIKTLDELEKLRMSAMRRFLDDYDLGKIEGRYIYYELPNHLPYSDNTFDIGLSSHFLLMYTALGYDFHIAAITEMLRVCKEIRIFPIVDLDANKTELIDAVIKQFSSTFNAEIKSTDYEFQKNANKVLIITR